MRPAIWLSPLTLLIVGIACSKTPNATGSTGMLKVGAAAPDFVARDAAGNAVHFADGAPHPRVVYFYPKDETPGCTREACAFRDAFAGYEKRGILLYGVSRDTEKSHEEFRAHHQLPFLLAADVDGDIQRAYGVPGSLGVSARVTFLVDGSGKISHVWEKVDPASHAEQILAEVP